MSKPEHNDRRSVATDALETLGEIIDENQKRDAIHLAVEPMIAACSLRPGQDVGICNPGYASPYADEMVGIVDPFLKETVQKGERFWLVVYPRQIKSLRHVWTHPAFPETPDVTLAPKENQPTKYETRLREIADEIGIDYEQLIDGAREYVEYDTRISEGGRFEGTGIPRDFWYNYEKVTGTIVPERDQGNFFSCSC